MILDQQQRADLYALEDKDLSSLIAHLSMILAMRLADPVTVETLEQEALDNGITFTSRH